MFATLIPRDVIDTGATGTRMAVAFVPRLVDVPDGLDILNLWDRFPGATHFYMRFLAGQVMEGVRVFAKSMSCFPRYICSRLGSSFIITLQGKN